MATEGERGRGGTTAKRQAILAAGLQVFARDGYAGSSIDDVAATAGVSTRTIYNHFGGKQGLYATVVEESARSVADTHIDAIDASLGSIRTAHDVEDQLIRCARALHETVPPDAPHWGLVRHLRADAENVPAEVDETWRRVGPARAMRQLALHFGNLARLGLLQLDDPEVAAAHYAALVSVDDSTRGPDGRATRSPDPVTAAVRTFLYGHLPGRHPIH